MSDELPPVEPPDIEDDDQAQDADGKDPEPPRDAEGRIILPPPEFDPVSGKRLPPPGAYRTKTGGWLLPPMRQGERARGNNATKGRRSVTVKLKSLMENRVLKNGQSLSEAMAAMAVTKALKGDYRYWKDIVDRLDGTALQRMKMVVEPQEDMMAELEYLTTEELTIVRDLLAKGRERMEAATGVKYDGESPADEGADDQVFDGEEPKLE